MTESRRQRAGRGQALVLMAVFGLVLALALLLTFSLGARAREKIKLLAEADAAAYNGAVAEARALNFYALSNRAIVSHIISILAVSSHQSYLTWYEDSMAATAHGFYEVSAQLKSCGCGGTKKRDAVSTTFWIAHMYEYAGTDVELRNLGPEWDKWCKGYPSDCWAGIARKGAKFFHDTWHDKIEQNFCYSLGTGMESHRERIDRIRGHQLSVDEELRQQLGGVSSNVQSRLQYSVRNGLDSWFSSSLSPAPPARQLASAVVALSDRGVKVSPASGNVSLDNYERAVSRGTPQGNSDDPQSRYHRDYDEVLSGTRFPDWLTQRGGPTKWSNGLESNDFHRDPNWNNLLGFAQYMARQKNNDTLAIGVVTQGTSKALTVGAPIDPGDSTPLNQANFYPADLPTTSGIPPTLTQQTVAGVKLAAEVHRGGHNDASFGDSHALAAEDHGQIMVKYTIGGCGCTRTVTTPVIPGRDGVYSDADDDPAQNSVSSPPHSFHMWHGQMMPITAHGIGGGSNGYEERPMGAHRGVYRGHMRFKLKTGGMWNMPRVSVVLTKPTDSDPSVLKKPWDLDFKMGLFGGVSHQSVDSSADATFNNQAGAIAGALVYYHRPAGFTSEDSREPPNLWNPFWRAKLHPVQHLDAAAALGPSHPESLRVLQDLESTSPVYQ